MLGDQSRIARAARAKREAKQRATILRQVEILEKLMALQPPDEPANGLLREVLKTIRSQLSENSNG